MAQQVYYPFSGPLTDNYVKQVKDFLINRGATFILNSGDTPKLGTNKLKTDDILHILGHGNNFKPNQLDKSINEKDGNIQANDLAARVKSVIEPSHKLIMLDCCFAMGMYKVRSSEAVWAGIGSEGKFLGQVLAIALGFDHPEIIVGGSVNATTSPQILWEGSPIGFEIGTKFTKSAKTEEFFKGKFREPLNNKDLTMVVPRVIYYVNNKGHWVNADGSSSNSPPKLW